MINLYNKIEGALDFTLWEFIKSSVATRLNIDNLPKENYIWTNLKDLAINCLQPIRDQFNIPIRILSGYRCELLNIAVGSSKNSNHCFGLVADIEPVSYDIKLISILDWIFKNLEFKELIAEYFPGGWIHIAYQKEYNKKVLKLKDKNHHYSKVDINYINKIYG